MICTLDVFNNLLLLVSDQIYLSTIIAMFTDVQSVPSCQNVTAALMQVKKNIAMDSVVSVIIN